MFKLCTLGIVLCLLAPSHETTPGTVVRVHQEALEYVCQEGRPFLIKGMMAIQVPAYKPPGFIFGSVLKIVGIKILDVQLPHLSVKLIPKTGVQLSFSSKLHMKGNILEWKLGSSILLDVRVTRSPSGFPILSITACKSLLGDIQILFGGNNLLGFLRPFQNHLRAILVDKMCLSVSNVVLGLNAHLRTMVGLNTINSMSHLQYSMLENPDITSEYMDLDLDAAFEMMGKPVQDSSPLPPFSLPPQETADDDSMVTMGLSDDMFEHFFQTLEKSGAFNLNIGGKSGSGDFHLSTSMLQSAIPSLAQKYPRDVAIALIVVLAELPVVTLKEGRATLSISPTIHLEVADSSSETLCSLRCVLALSLQVDVSPTYLQLSVALQGEMGLEMVSSSVKDVQVSKMRTIIVSVMEKNFLAHMNAVLVGGISLPKLANVQYTDGDIEIHEGYAQVNCDLDYKH
uniref:BPI fold-containing family B member 2 n=1 Tax=Euleptes europaea TaxID=460621 RepID=UPI002540178B|nr:BPI fold-containing family B member 2 [Euleptes europaea]